MFSLATFSRFKRILCKLVIAVVASLPISLGAQAADSEAQTVPVEVREIGGLIPVGGTIVPYKEVTLSAQLPGRVEFIAGEEGDRFPQGKVLVGLDEDELLARRRAAQAQIATAEASMRNAGVQYSRERRAPRSNNMMDQFMPGNPMSQFIGGDKSRVERRADLYSRQVQIEQSRHGLMQAQSQLQEIDAKLRDTKGVAPFDGVVIKKYVNIGDTVQPGQPLINFADVRVLQVQADVPARLVNVLSLGAPIEARLDDAKKTRVQARIAQVFPMADPTRHTVRVKFDLPEGSPVAPGMYAEVMIEDPGVGPSGEYAVIPISSVVWRGGLPMVYVILPNERTELRLLRLGDRVDRDHIIVLTGLVGDERVLKHPK